MGLELKKINIKGNPFIKDKINYKNEIFEMFLSLICVDDCDKEGNDIESTEYGDAQNYYFEQVDDNDENFGEDDNENEYEYDVLESNSNENDLKREEEEEEEENESELNDNIDEDNNDGNEEDDKENNKDDNKENN